MRWHPTADDYRFKQEMLSELERRDESSGDWKAWAWKRRERGVTAAPLDRDTGLILLTFLHPDTALILSFLVLLWWKAKVSTFLHLLIWWQFDQVSPRRQIAEWHRLGDWTLSWGGVIIWDYHYSITITCDRIEMKHWWIKSWILLAPTRALMTNCKINGTVQIFLLKKSYLRPRWPRPPHFFP